MIIENKKYFISKSFDYSDKIQLLQIISILRNLRKILEEKLDK
jgi:hypothetical protein